MKQLTYSASKKRKKEKVNPGSLAASVVQICSSLGSNSIAGQAVIKAKMQCFVQINALEKKRLPNSPMQILFFKTEF